MKITRYLILTAAVMTLLGVTAQAQRTRRPATKPASTKTVATLPPLEVRAARVKVENQFANVRVFVERLGPIAQALEALDAESKSKKLSKETLDKQAADKKKVVAAISGLREGMMKLESEFKIKPALKKWLPTIQGITDLAGQSETSAIAGRFVAANTPLRTIQQKLNDTLASMPTAEL